jgi:hypothetical protein
MRDCEVKIEYKPQGKQPNEKMSEFVVVDHSLMMPASSFKLIQDTIVTVGSIGYGDNKIWHRKADQSISVQKVSFAQAVAMCVNEKLEAANGNKT